MRVVNLGARPAESFIVEFYLSDNARQDLDEDFRLYALETPIRQLAIGGEKILSFRFFELPDLAIDGISQEFYFWPRVVFVETGGGLNLQGRWIRVYEELADLVGAIHEIPASAMPGEEIGVRYSTKNYGRVFRWKSGILAKGF